MIWGLGLLVYFEYPANADLYYIGQTGHAALDRCKKHSHSIRLSGQHYPSTAWKQVKKFALTTTVLYRSIRFWDQKSLLAFLLSLCHCSTASVTHSLPCPLVPVQYVKSGKHTQWYCNTYWVNLPCYKTPEIRIAKAELKNTESFLSLLLNGRSRFWLMMQLCD